MTKSNDELKIICPFCNAPYTAEMVDGLWAGAYENSYGDPSAELEGKFEIKCSNCKKVVYVKEFI